MVSSTCSVCFRAVRRQSLQVRQISNGSISRQRNRTFVTASRLHAVLPGPNAIPASSIPPVSPKRAVGADPSQTPLSAKAAAELRKVAGKSTATYTAYGVTEILYRECSKHADYAIPQAADKDAEMPKTEDGEDLGIGEGWWHTELGLKPTFSTWSQVTMLHMYLLSVRFRCFPGKDSQPWQQHLLDHFFYEAENKMTINHNMHASGTRNKYLKDLFVQWRGLLAAYDEGLVKGDAVLAAAIWRNVFKADEEIDVKSLSTIVSYMRRALRSLDALHDGDVTAGAIVFGDPNSETDLVRSRSRMMDLPFKDGKVENEPKAD